MSVISRKADFRPAIYEYCPGEAMVIDRGDEPSSAPILFLVMPYVYSWENLFCAVRYNSSVRKYLPYINCEQPPELFSKYLGKVEHLWL